ncbi:DUF6403 family protein [Actinoplanes sp. G11-F43]|uniref:DUF6403 family protein n=1 Tax=Actinoplanes sp. G11-F43 TaxID=3424130 RepID=UPI003D325583
MWWIWAAGTVVLFGSGFAMIAVPRLRERAVQRRVAWSEAHTAIATAMISRDAARTDDPEATEMLHRAEMIAAARGGPDAAREAAGLARRADRIWGGRGRH